MSTVFASQVDGWNDDGWDGGWNDDPEFRFITPQNNADLEGYSGSPSHYIDIEETPEVYFAQKSYESFEQKNYSNNIDIVKECMKSGIVLPSKDAVKQIIEKLKTISKGS